MKERYFSLIVLVVVMFLFVPSTNAVDKRMRRQKAAPTVPKSTVPKKMKLSEVLFDYTDIDYSVKEIFKNILFEANTCTTPRRIIMSFRDIYYFKKQPLKLNFYYELTDREKKSTQSRGSAYYTRVTKIRACVEDWKELRVASVIVSGRFRMYIKLGKGWIGWIDTMMLQDKKIYGVWKNKYSWKSIEADNAILDLRLRPMIQVELTPAVDDRGRLSYTGVKVSSAKIIAEWWEGGRNGAKVRKPRFRFPKSQQMIESYGQRVLEVLRDSFRRFFTDNRIRTVIAETMTKRVKVKAQSGGTPIDTIVSVSLDDRTLEKLVVYYKPKRAGVLR
jgi:hypothetical protein